MEEVNRDTIIFKRLRKTIKPYISTAGNQMRYETGPSRNVAAACKYLASKSKK
jgi:hypothetical protein